MKKQTTTTTKPQSKKTTPTPKPAKHLLTTLEAAALASVHVESVRRWVRNKEIKPAAIAGVGRGAWFFRKGDILRMKKRADVFRPAASR